MKLIPLTKAQPSMKTKPINAAIEAVSRELPKEKKPLPLPTKEEWEALGFVVPDELCSKINHQPPTKEPV